MKSKGTVVPVIAMLNLQYHLSSYAFPYSTYKPYAGKKHAIVKQTGYKHKGPVSKPPGVVSQETVVSGSKLAKKEEWKKNVEICAYTEHGRLKKISNFPMTLTNDTAKVDIIAEFISQELFDGTVVFLIDVDNLKIRDSTVTCKRLEVIFYKFPYLSIKNCNQQ